MRRRLTGSRRLAFVDPGNLVVRPPATVLVGLPWYAGFVRPISGLIGALAGLLWCAAFVGPRCLLVGASAAVLVGLLRPTAFVGASGRLVAARPEVAFINPGNPLAGACHALRVSGFAGACRARGVWRLAGACRASWVWGFAGTCCALWARHRARACRVRRFWDLARAGATPLVRSGPPGSALDGPGRLVVLRPAGTAYL